MSDPVNVLVVDDSALMRNLVSKIIEATPGLKVADKAMKTPQNMMASSIVF